jgi:MFS family permease
MAATDPAAQLAVTPEQVVARERPVRTRAGLAALAAAVLTIGANMVQNATLADRPAVNEIDALRDAAGESLGRPGLGTDQVLFLHDHTAGLLAGAVLQALVAVLTGFVLLVLLRSTLDRGGSAPRPTRILVIIGAAAAGLGTLLLSIGLAINTADFASSSDQGTQAAHDATHGGGVLVTGTLMGLVGLFAMAAAFVLVALAAMRSGLLTRFVGVLGAIVGVLQILGPLSTGSFIVTAFWLAMVGALLLGRWPSGMPPAWDAGEARPWPSQQEIREQRERQRAERGRRGGGTPAPAGPAEPASAAPSPATSARKKRKRRS